jgi:hypothetical protein
MMRKNVAPSTCDAKCRQFADVTRDVLRGKAATNGNRFQYFLTGNFPIINPKEFRVPA